MSKIIRFHEIGGTEVLRIEDLPLAEPGEGEIRLKVEAFSQRLIVLPKTYLKFLGFYMVLYGLSCTLIPFKSPF